MTRLGRLYKYAKSSSALENFTTEALASAILKDPKPWVAVLRACGVLSGDDVFGKPVVNTQVRMSGDDMASCLDLVVEFPSPTAPVWVEVKVNAGEHGNQLERYQALANKLSPPARLVTLARTSEVKPGVPGLSWRELYEAIDAESDVYWHELRDFMDEHQMIVYSEDSISDGEITGMLGTLELLGKLTERLHRFTRNAKARSVPVSFPESSTAIRAMLGDQFGRFGRLCIRSSKGPPTLLVGLRGFGPEKEVRLLCRVEHPPKKTDFRKKLFDVADANGLDNTWVRGTQSWPALVKSTPLDAANRTLKGTVEWWTRALRELEDAKILDLLPS